MNKSELGNWIKVSDKIDLEESELQKLQKNYNSIKSKELINSLKVFIKTLGTNIKYSFEDINSKNMTQLLETNNFDFILFGEKINKNNIKTKGKKILDNLAWFSYRKNFPYIFSEKGIFFTTDANWGCTIRVCQMMLFSVFYGFFVRKYELEKIGPQMKNKLREGILSNFLDCPFKIFSIYNFCRIGKMRKNAKVGEFWKPNITVSNMMRLLQEQKKISINLDVDYEIQNKKNEILYKSVEINKNERINLEKKQKTSKPQKKAPANPQKKTPKKLELNTSEIEIYLSADGVIFCQEIAKKLYNPSLPSLCTCAQPQTYKFPLNFGLKFPSLCPKCDFTKTLIIFCFLRTGLYKSEPQNLAYLKELVKNDKFSGGMIGKGNSAYYLVGISGNNFIYLDPHFVQNSKFESFEQLFGSYDVLKMRSIREDRLNVCVGVSFKICSFREYRELIGFFDCLKERFRDSFYLSFVKNDEEDY